MKSPPLFLMKLTRQGKCDVCQKWVARDSLRRMLHDTLSVAGENRLAYSDYDPAGWAHNCPYNPADLMTAFPALGIDGDARVVVNDDNTLSYVNMAQPWSTTGGVVVTVRTSVPANFTGAANVMFAVHVGLHHRDSHTPIQVALGTCASDGSNQQEWLSQSIPWAGRPWFSVPAASITQPLNDLYFYITCTPSYASSWWYFQGACAMDATSPNGKPLYSAHGAAISYPTDTVQRLSLVTCPECREKIFAYRNLRGRARKETDPVIPPETWEE